MVAANTLQSHDFVLGTLIAAGTAAVFALLGSGSSLLVTVVPGIAVAWAVFVLMYYQDIPLPDARSFLPAFFTTLAIQFIDFGEEFVTGFNVSGPGLSGGSAVQADLYVWATMIAYAAVTLSCVLLCYRHKGFLLVPALFFVICGVIGNAVSHTFWVVHLHAYVPGVFTAFADWICGPWLLFKLLGSRSDTAAVTVAFGTLLALLLSAVAV